MIYTKRGHKDFFSYQIYDYMHPRADEYGYVHYTREGHKEYLKSIDKDN